MRIRKRRRCCDLWRVHEFLLRFLAVAVVVVVVVEKKKLQLLVVFVVAYFHL